MSVVSIFSLAFCRGAETAREVGRRLGWPVLNDEDLVARAQEDFALPPDKLRRHLQEPASIFNKFSREKERCTSFLKLALARLLADDHLVFQGWGSALVPRGISHFLAVGLVGGRAYRLAEAARQGVAEKEALARMRREDEAAALWVGSLHNLEPWSPELYDMLISQDHRPWEEAVALIADAATGPLLAPNAASRQAMEDFLLSARVEVALAVQGHHHPDLKVCAHRGKVLVEINKKVFRLGKLEDELRDLVGKQPGVTEVETRVGPGYHQADIYRKVDFELPSKILLVDDEREFVDTLSERLMLRDIGTAVVYDGAQALDLLEEEEPEVMVLDLRMPGVDGMEVLTTLKAKHPRVEVIVLTGHGSPKDRDTCLKMGAFAYLQKPVDIEELSEVMRRAYEKVRSDAEGCEA
ncbi:MAG: response regulator [Deltaproteobacteria bacterium]|nr:response regulator [Deltaproteobacteria bacterium]